MSPTATRMPSLPPVLRSRPFSHRKLSAGSFPKTVSRGRIITAPNKYNTFEISPKTTPQLAPLSLLPTSPSRGIPWSLLSVVTVDAFLDGILIGMAITAGTNMGWMMTIALSVEMFFLGITTSSTLVKRGVHRALAILLSVAIPLFLILGGVAGFTVCASFAPPGFLACLSFGVAALIYLVCDELLVEAHENLENDTWYVTAQLFVGFFLSTAYTIFSE